MTLNQGYDAPGGNSRSRANEAAGAKLRTDACVLHVAIYEKHYLFLPPRLIVSWFCMKEFPDVCLDLINVWRRSRVGGVIILFSFFRHS